MEKFKILITGKNQPLVDELKKDISATHSIMSCSFTFSDIENHLNMVSPGLLIICLQSELMDDIITLDNVSKITKKENIKTFIAGTKDDCEYYNDNIDIKPDKAFHAPVSVDDMISEIEAVSAEKDDDFDITSIMGADGHLDMQKVVNYEYVQAKPQVDPLVRRRVLVIDDSPIMLRLIKEQLSWKYDVAVAVSGKIAYKYLESNSVSLILLDYDMPGESGPQVFVKLREDPKLKNVPIIFLTGVNDNALIKKALSLGPQGYLLKPVDNDRLMETVAKFIG